MVLVPSALIEDGLINEVVVGENCDLVGDGLCSSFSRAVSRALSRAMVSIFSSRVCSPSIVIGEARDGGSLEVSLDASENAGYRGNGGPIRVSDVCSCPFFSSILYTKRAGRLTAWL